MASLDDFFAKKDNKKTKKKNPITWPPMSYTKRWRNLQSWPRMPIP